MTTKRRPGLTTPGPTPDAQTPTTKSGPIVQAAGDLAAACCRVCGVDLPVGHLYCTRVCAAWDRKEHLADEVGRWPV
jgi:hypothetical protein